MTNNCLYHERFIYEQIFILEILVFLFLETLNEFLGFLRIWNIEFFKNGLNFVCSKSNDNYTSLYNIINAY